MKVHGVSDYDSKQQYDALFYALMMISDNYEVTIVKEWK